MDNINEINKQELQQEERIMSYLQGKMSNEEESAFLEELKNDEDFKAKAINIARLAKGISQVGEERDKILKEALLSVDEATIRAIAQDATKAKVAVNAADIIGSESKQAKTKVVSFKQKYATILSVAASLLFIVYFGFLYNDYSKTLALGDQYASTYDTSTMRGDEQPEVEKEVESLINNVYNNTDLSASLKRLAVLWEVSTMETYNDYTNYASELGWALATGYLKDNNKADAKAVLEKMAKLYDADSAMGKKVRELQEKIANL